MYSTTGHMSAAVKPGAALNSTNCPTEDLKDLKSNNKKLYKKDLFRDKESLTTYVCAVNPVVLSERLLGSSYMLLKYFSLWAKQA